MLDEGDGLKRVAGTVEAHYRNERQTLKDLIGLKGASAQVMSVTRPSGKRKLGLVVRRIPLREESEGKGRPAWVIYLEDECPLPPDLRARLAVEGVGDGNRFPLPMNQQEIGEATGMTGIYVNRANKRYDALTQDIVREAHTGATR